MEPLNSRLEPVIEEDPEEDKILEAAVAGNSDEVWIAWYYVLQLEKHIGKPIHNLKNFIFNSKW